MLPACVCLSQPARDWAQQSRNGGTFLSSQGAGAGEGGLETQLAVTESDAAWDILLSKLCHCPCGMKKTNWPEQDQANYRIVIPDGPQNKCGLMWGLFLFVYSWPGYWFNKNYIIRKYIVYIRVTTATSRELWSYSPSICPWNNLFQKRDRNLEMEVCLISFPSRVPSRF